MNARFAIRSVKTKLLIAFLGLGLVPMGTVGYLAYERATESLTTDAGNSQIQTAYNVADKIDRNYFERYGDVQAFALAAGAIRDWGRLRTLVDEFMVAYGFYDLMILVDRAGKIQVVNTVDHSGKPLDTRTIAGADVSGEEWFQKAINGGIKSGETLTDAPARHGWTTALYGDEEVVTTFTAAIRDASGNVIGVWRNYASLQRVADGILEDARKAAKESGNVDLIFTLVDNKGIKLHDDISEEGELTANMAAEWESARRVAAHETGFVRQVDEKAGASYIAGFAASSQAFMPKYGWGVIVRVTEAQALAPAMALRNAVLLVAAIATILLVVVAMWMAGTIARPIATTAEVMRSISEDGDLTKRLTATSQDELGDLAHSFNSFVARLGDIAKGIRGSSANVATASRELSSVADDISSAAQSQASSLEQTAASMEEITATVKQNAENAGQASRLATTAREVADKGGRVVGDAVGAMSEINRSSKKIAEIITTIDEIAFQTNLLALNA
ncbi:MAG: HAMP domain-containing protein, partial [Gemmatimonadetes bacterium]|nr:HAMP domain-containing protein [Gemmatimonadota bacterium]